MEKKTMVIIGCVSVVSGVGTYLFKRFAWPKLKDKIVKHEEEWWEAEEIEEDHPTVDYLHIPTDEEIQEKSTLSGFEMKPDISKIAYNKVVEAYKSVEGDILESDSNPEETMPYMCTVHEYLDEWPYYKKCTLSWYPAEKRLVNLDEGFEVIMPPYENVVGIYISDILNEKNEWVDEAYYAVDKENEKCYEILKVEDSTYMDDLDDFKNINGGA